ncbi:hypothetical protein [Mesorhizobium sp. M7A.T.Ca.TU.009.02.1.1]|uniref:hypothetical protein n=1 Tax=Mesorhizobium sp. M7A.T.Ca.TU.009.02.1.1 TaxID=2496791 RepID=UPI000FCAE310|nr:hypothetical protein [Mesorhizobium sp. M7A.T.Ca.TU.009.02.1.1]RUT98892.1 hypothetical protein EOD12_23340 [Mesorhizobium sp. M7A.T.Ca.TU.009.02.1.1]
MDLLLTVPGASPEEIARGIAAANEVLDRAGISALEAADGMFAIEGWDDASFADESLPTGEENEAASAWIEASRAALDACCADWPAEKRPVAADLQLVDSATQLADRPTALAMLRALTAAQDGNGEFMNSQIGILADRLAVDLDNPRDLIAAVTVAFTRLELAGFYPAEPIEPKRQAVYDAINALEAATKMPTSH